MEPVEIVERGRWELEELLASTSIASVSYEIRALVEEASIALANVRQYLKDPSWFLASAELTGRCRVEPLLEHDLGEAASFVARGPEPIYQSSRGSLFPMAERCA
jgi:hypothetical protein